MIRIPSSYAATCLRLPGARHTLHEAWRAILEGVQPLQFDATDPSSPLVIGRVMEPAVLELARLKLSRNTGEPVALYHMSATHEIDVCGMTYREDSPDRGCLATYDIASCHPDALLVAHGSRRIWLVDAKTSRLWQDWMHADIPDPVVAQLIHTWACIAWGSKFEGYTLQREALVAVALSLKGGVQLRSIPISQEWIDRWWTALHWFHSTYLTTGTPPPAETFGDLPVRYPVPQGSREATPAEVQLIHRYHAATKAATAADNARESARDAVAQALQGHECLTRNDKPLLTRKPHGKGFRLDINARNLPETNDHE